MSFFTGYSSTVEIIVAQLVEWLIIYDMKFKIEEKQMGNLKVHKQSTHQKNYPNKME